jgi:hypothetical protein
LYFFFIVAYFVVMTGIAKLYARGSKVHRREDKSLRKGPGLCGFGFLCPGRLFIAILDKGDGRSLRRWLLLFLSALKRCFDVIGLRHFLRGPGRLGSNTR